MGKLSQRFGPVSVSTLAGSACFWAWVDALFASVFFGPFGQTGAMAESAAWLTSLLGAPVALALLARPAFARHALADVCVLVVLGVLGTLGSLSFVLAAWLGSWTVLVGACVAAAPFLAGGVAAWGAAYCRDGVRTAVLYAGGGFAFAIVPELLFIVMVRPVPSFLFALMPVASMLLLAAVSPAERSYEEAGRRDAEVPREGVASARRPFPAGFAHTPGVSTTAMCALVFVMLGFGYMQHLVSFAGLEGLAATDGGVTVQTARAIVAAVLFGVTLVFPRGSHVAYRTGLLTVVAGFSLMPFLFGGHFFWVSGVVIMAGYTVFDVLMWIVVAQVGYVRLGNALWAVCVLQVLVKGLFGVLGAVSAVVLQRLAADAVFACADAIFVGYLMTVAIVLLLSNRGVWELFAAHRPAAAHTPTASDDVGARVAALADACGLTDREREVVGYLAVGRTQPWVAQTLGISESTVNSHVRHIYGKLGINGKQELLDLVSRQG